MILPCKDNHFYWKNNTLSIRFLNNALKNEGSPLIVADERASLSEKVAASYSPALHCSTIGAGGLNFSVRNGKRWDPAAITT